MNGDRKESQTQDVPRQPAGLPPADEGILSAHRQFIGLFLAEMVGRGQAGIDALDALERRLGYDDYHEDPGVEPDPAFAIQRAADAEVRRVIRDVRAMVSAGDVPSGKA